MKILEDKGYIYQKHMSTGGEGEVHLIKSVDKDFIAKIFPILSDSSIDVLKTIQKLNIQGIPKIYEIFNHKDKTIVIRDYVEGTTLFDEIKKNEHLSFKRAKNILLSICSTLKQLHNAKPAPVIYRDLKPENIIITPQGNAMLIDFGIARHYKMESTRDTVLAGTKGYTAPEVMAGMQSDVRSDVYSVGLLFYEMLTGKSLLVPPFQIRPVKESNQYLPEWIDGVITKASNLNQTKRYKTIDELIDAIENPERNKTGMFDSNKVRKIILTITLSTVIIVSTMLVINSIINTEGNQNEDNTISVSEHMDKQNYKKESENYNIIVDLEFDDKTDAAWLETMGENSNIIIAEECIENGVYTLKEEIQLKQSINQGKFAHIQVIVPDFDKSGPMFMVDLSYNQGNSDSELSFFRFYFENNQPLRFDIQKPDRYANVNQLDTAMLIQNNMRVDIIVWLNEEDSSLRYIISDANVKNKICYMGIKLDDIMMAKEWKLGIALDTEYWNGSVSNEDLYTDIEFLRISSGSIRRYLADNILAYKNNEENIEVFITNDMPYINDLEYYKYGE